MPWKWTIVLSHLARTMLLMTTTATHQITPRLYAGKAAPAPYSAMVAFDDAIELDPPLRELVKLRASQLNGCAYCLDMHASDARAGGEEERRLHTLAGWRESPFFTDRERAALALTDAVTRMGEHGVGDDVWGDAAAHFDEPELAQLLWAIAAINVWNRIAVTTHLVPES
jgi:AhpD family alkylhydroperoxidase